MLEEDLLDRKFVKTARETLGQLPRAAKRAILICFDIAMLWFCAWAAYSLRLNTFFVPSPTQLAIIGVAPAAAFPIFIRLGLYRAVIRYLPGRAFWTIANAVIVATLLWIFILFGFEISNIGGTVPRSVPAIYCLLGILIIGGSRFAAKFFLWTPLRRNYSSQVLIYGAGEAGTQLADALLRDGQKYVLGFVDDDKALQGRDVAGRRVYPASHIPHLMEATGVKEIVLSIPSADAVRRQEIVANLSQYQIKIRTLPALADLAAGRYLAGQLREIDIDDILGRSTVPAEPELLRPMIEGRTILVSGAGGSIGSELCRLVVKWAPTKLVLFEANEFSLYQINRILEKRTKVPIIPILGSVSDKKLIAKTLKAHAVDVVFHAAAHKHVPLVEANALEGIRNNVFGTQCIAEAAYAAGVQNFVLISSDKAVRPTNVMGATKRWAELTVRDFAEQARASNSGQKFCSVRFGNVLGSNGSVVPLFKEQISLGGPVTVTDVEMTRYFMSIHEAAELIVQAGTLSTGGDIFLLEMGNPVRIMDLAENMIRLAGLGVRNSDNPDGEIAISIVGRRPAEKTHEELFYDPDGAHPTAHPKILRAEQLRDSMATFGQHLDALGAALETDNEETARQILFDLVIERDPRHCQAEMPIRQIEPAQ